MFTQHLPKMSSPTTFVLSPLRVGISIFAAVLPGWRMEVVTDFLAGPMPEALQSYVGDLTVVQFLFDWFPLLLVTILPVICIPFVALGICGTEIEQGGDLKMGVRRVLKGGMLAVRADIRMHRESIHTVMLKKAGFKKGGPRWMQPTSSALESGLARSRVTAACRGSPPSGGKSKDQSKGKAEEKAIKTGNARFY